jgi:hypothetical protein
MMVRVLNDSIILIRDSEIHTRRQYEKNFIFSVRCEGIEECFEHGQKDAKKGKAEKI